MNAIIRSILWTITAAISIEFGVVIGQTTTQSACGTCTITESMNMTEATACAEANAIEQALIAAGAARRVTATSTLMELDNGRESASRWSEISEVSWNGGVTRVANQMINKSHDELGDFVVEVCADFSVQLYETVTDAGFRFEVGSLKPAYMDQEELTFSVQGPPGCMQAWLIEGGNAYRFFPNPSEPNSCWDANATIHLPSDASQQRYVLDWEPEAMDHTLLLLFTKSDLAAGAPSEWSEQSLRHWLNQIEPSERFVHHHQFWLDH